MPLPILVGTHRVAVTRQPGNQSSSTNVKPAMFAPVMAALSSVEVVATELDGASPTVAQAFVGGNWLGAGAGDPHFAPSIILTLKTAERGRRRTGRIFLGSISEDATNNGRVADAIITPLQAAWTTFLADATSAGIPLHVASYGHVNDPTAVPPDPYPTFAPASLAVTSVTVQSVLGTQRRRQSRLR
jgi:hypothetical protein